MTVPSPEDRPPRALCAACALPSAACLCALVTHVGNATPLLVLQHPLEAREAKGTVRLLSRCLARCRVVVRETFDAASLSTLLHFEGRRSVLLYPHDADAIGADQFDVGIDAQGHRHSLQLVVLDGTWRKSVKMLQSNAALQALPRLALQPLAPGAYAPLRKARLATQLSTLEAACAALALLDDAPERYAPVLRSFARFVENGAARAPASSQSSAGETAP